jgi:hypothetical protein
MGETKIWACSVLDKMQKEALSNMSSHDLKCVESLERNSEYVSRT